MILRMPLLLPWFEDCVEISVAFSVMTFLADIIGFSCINAETTTVGKDKKKDVCSRYHFAPIFPARDIRLFLESGVRASRSNMLFLHQLCNLL